MALQGRIHRGMYFSHCANSFSRPAATRVTIPNAELMAHNLSLLVQKNSAHIVDFPGHTLFAICETLCSL